MISIWAKSLSKASHLGSCPTSNFNCNFKRTFTRIFRNQKTEVFGTIFWVTRYCSHNRRYFPNRNKCPNGVDTLRLSLLSEKQFRASLLAAMLVSETSLEVAWAFQESSLIYTRYCRKLIWNFNSVTNNFTQMQLL